jgi:hypothetical protein
MGWYEMDVFKLTHAGIMYEYEIKISRSDFKQDFKKGTINYHKQVDKNSGKHFDIRAGKCKCNKFFFVVPENLITKDEVPEYAGLIYYCVSDYGGDSLRTVKPAKIIHKNKYTDFEGLAKKLAWRCEIYQGKVNYANGRAKDVITKCTNLLKQNNIEIPYFLDF